MRLIAKKAISKNTRARGLREILENILMESMFEVCKFCLLCRYFRYWIYASFHSQRLHTTKLWGPHTVRGWMYIYDACAIFDFGVKLIECNKWPKRSQSMCFCSLYGSGFFFLLIFGSINIRNYHFKTMQLITFESFPDSRY